VKTYLIFKAMGGGPEESMDAGQKLEWATLMMRLNIENNQVL
jgi:hypothetical protein